MKIRHLATSVLGVVIGIVTAAHAAPNFEGQQISIFTGFGAGGTYHQYAQLFSRHLGHHLPGSPRVIVQSMPGAGGVRMLNEAAARMPGDGTNLFLPPDTMIVTQLLAPDGIAFDARQFRYIGVADQQNTFLAVRRSSGSTVDDLRRIETHIGSSGTGSTGYIITSIAKPLLGLKTSIVGGYQGSQDTILAMERREVDGTVQGWQVWTQARRSWFEGPDSFAATIFQVGVTSDPDAPATPLLSTLVRPEDRPIVSILDTMGLLGRSLAAPASTSQQNVEVLRAAFEKMTRSAAFEADIHKMGLRSSPRSGQELEKAVSDAVSGANDQIIARARGLLK